MNQRIWLITGISSGFGRHLTEQLLDRGDRVVGTVRRPGSVADLADKYADLLRVEGLDVRDTPALRDVVARTVAELGRIDVLVSNAGYGVFGAAEELSDEQVDDILATNLTASIQLIRAVLPHMREAGGGRIVQLSSYGGQVAFPGNSLYHATKWGIEGFCESVAQEVAQFGVGVTIVEPGGARTEFRYGSAQVADPLPDLRGHPSPIVRENAGSRQRPGGGRPGSHGLRHHRQRRRAARTAPADARLAGLPKHRGHAAEADRRLRSAEGRGRLH